MGLWVLWVIPDALDHGIHIDFTTLDAHYRMIFGSNDNGDPIVSLIDNSQTWNPGEIYILDGYRSGYHLYELIFNPILQSASFYVDNSLVASGFGGAAPSNYGRCVTWGSASSPATGQGNFNLVQL